MQVAQVKGKREQQQGHDMYMMIVAGIICFLYLYGTLKCYLS